MQNQDLSAIERVRKITKLIRYFEKKTRNKFLFLESQNFLGMFFFLFAILGMMLGAIGYVLNWIPFWIVIPLNAFFASILHELEHDLIHGLYFKDTAIEKWMMQGVWIFRGNTPDPFYRKKIHLHHHKESGQITDIEEQMIGNGMKYNIKRMIVMIDQHLSFLINGRKVAKTSPTLNLKEMFRSGFPILAIFYTLFYSFAIGNILLFTSSHFQWELPEVFPKIVNLLNIIAVIYVLPNLLRQASLQFISSTMHYFGDVTPGKAGLVEQTQVLNHPVFWFFQLFCFNFGSTHGIHHFVVNQPFYLRQMISPGAHSAMKKYGVRFNDWKTFLRSNRYGN